MIGELLGQSCEIGTGDHGPALVGGGGDPAPLDPSAHGVVTHPEDVGGFRNSVRRHTQTLPQLRRINKTSAASATSLGVVARRNSPPVTLACVSERPGRYPRSASGLIGALLVLLLVVGGFVLIRALGRDELEVRPEPVDYLPVVEALQQAGHSVAYPPRLPAGWEATSVDSAPGTDAVFGLGMLTADERFAGIRQEATALESLVEVYVDQDATAGDTVRAGTGELAGEWQTFTDQDGDTAFGREGRDATVLVYGSASRADLLAMLDGLTLEPVAPASG